MIFLKQIKCILCGIALTLFLPIDNSTQAVWPVIPNVLLSAEPAIVLPPPSGGTVIPFPTPKIIPTQPVILSDPAPILVPKIDDMKFNPEKGGTPVARRAIFNTKKAAKQAAERAARKGGGGGSGGGKKLIEQHTKGKHGPHFHPVGKHDHYYYPKTVTVTSGDSLWKIAQKYGLDHNKLAEINGITDPKKLMPGQVIKLG